MRNDQLIQNLTSKFKSSDIWPIFGRKIGEIPDLAYFRQFFWQKRVKYYSIFILRSDLESSHHFAYLGPHLIWFSHFDFWHPMLFYLTTNVGGDINFFEKMLILMRSSWSELKMHKNTFIRLTFIAVYLSWVWYRWFLVLNRRNIQGNFFDKKRSRKKTAEMRKPLRFMRPKGDPKGGLDKFSDWC